jgi:hypothetical protein
MRLYPQISRGFDHVGDVGDFAPDFKKPLHIAAFIKSGVGVCPDLKPQLPDLPSNLYSAGLPANSDDSECGYSPYGRGQHLRACPSPLGKVSRAQIDFSTKTKGANHG